VPGAFAARTLGASFKALADVKFTGDTKGVIFVQGSRFGGFTMFVKGGKLVFAYNSLGIPPAVRPLPAVRRGIGHRLGRERRGEQLVRGKASTSLAAESRR
jgi:hypothetical protein